LLTKLANNTKLLFCANIPRAHLDQGSATKVFAAQNIHHLKHRQTPNGETFVFIIVPGFPKID
jgi:hypothetical protein